MAGANISYQIEMVFLDKQTLKELLTEMLIEQIREFDSDVPLV